MMKSQIAADAARNMGVPVVDIPIARKEMPQIRSADLPAFAEWAEARGVNVSNKWIRASVLQFKQAVDAEHARAMPDAVLEKPIVVSCDMVVLDGNHRAAANAALGNMANVVIVGLPFAGAVDLMFEFPGVMDLAQSVAVRGR